MFGVNPLIARKYPVRKNKKYESVLGNFYSRFSLVLNTKIKRINSSPERSQNYKFGFQKRRLLTAQKGLYRTSDSHMAFRGSRPIISVRRPIIKTGLLVFSLLHENKFMNINCPHTGDEYTEMKWRCSSTDS